ncbi:MAG: hypothetical protein HC881_13170 [Leptolyngbyaceae cyanobacterium SL_7_1]|nr:hypothetical protein [Leptolyngbyaceae cyanobacterium SL_7_1]
MTNILFCDQTDLSVQSVGLLDDQSNSRLLEANREFAGLGFGTIRSPGTAIL